MLETVYLGAQRLSDHRGVAPDAILDELEARADALRGARVLHVNATPYGGGVTELLRSAVPLLNDLGLVADWKIIHGDKAFFEVTKALHNALQGAPRDLTEAERDQFLRSSQQNAAALEEDYDFVFVHDPQPAALLGLRGKGDARWIWRCHIDTSHPNAEAWRFLRPHLAGYDAAVFTMAEFVPPDLPIGRVEIVPPAIDPLSPKNVPLPDDLARRLLAWVGVNPGGPLVTQVSRFDPWKDPLGVIAAYRLAREEIPELQLALVGSMAHDDPESWGIYSQLLEETATDPHVHLCTNLTGVGNIEVNAFHRLSRVVIQKSLREGFGLTVSEALWKGTPVVAGRAGGITLQMADGVGGYLVDSVEACADALVRLLMDEAEAQRLGRVGRERVRAHFLLPRLLLNEVTLMQALAGERPIHRPSDWWQSRDPVCGMALVPGAPAIVAEHGGRRYGFCSQECRALFEENPTHYLQEAPDPA